MNRPGIPVVTGQVGGDSSTIIKIPEKYAHEISLEAARRVRARAPLGPNRSRTLIRATWRKGQIGVHFPPQAIHLFMLDRGIKAFNMTALEGKTIPIRGPNGFVSFRVAKNVGKRKITTRDEKGRIITSKIAWRHPGVSPMNFVEPAIKEAVEHWFQNKSIGEIVAMMEHDEETAEFFSMLVHSSDSPKVKEAKGMKGMNIYT